MAHTKWCKEECTNCKSQCDLDLHIPCSPDCINLLGDKIKLSQCLADGCDEIGYIFDAYNPEDISDEEAERLMGKYGEIADYPY